MLLFSAGSGGRRRRPLAVSASKRHWWRATAAVRANCCVERMKNVRRIPKSDISGVKQRHPLLRRVVWHSPSRYHFAHRPVVSTHSCCGIPEWILVTVHDVPCLSYLYPTGISSAISRCGAVFATVPQERSQHVLGL